MNIFDLREPEGAYEGRPLHRKVISGNINSVIRIFDPMIEIKKHHYYQIDLDTGYYIVFSKEEMERIKHFAPLGVDR